jgi:DASS family divalent anion:Na+ symporter
MPLAIAIAGQMGEGPNSPARKGLTLAVFANGYTTALISPTGSVQTVFLADVIKTQLPAYAFYGTMGGWFIFIGLPSLILGIISWFVLVRFWPRSKDAGKMSKTYLDEQLKKIGPMKPVEKRILALVVIAVLLWVFPDIFGIPDWATSLLIAVLMYSPKIGSLGIKDLRNISWDSLIFSTTVRTLTAIVVADRALYLANALFPVLSPFVGNVFIFALGLIVLYMSTNLVMTGMVILGAIMAPTMVLASAAGMNPMLVLGIFTLMCRQTILPHQNMIMCDVSGDIEKEGGYSTGDGTKFTALQTALWIPAILAIVVPYWMILGLV